MWPTSPSAVLSPKWTSSLLWASNASRWKHGDREVGTLIIETKGHDPLMEVKEAAARRWIAAVNADGAQGRWAYRLVRVPTDVAQAIASAAKELSED